VIATTASRYHDISCGHRVAGHESKCAFLHGHNYRIHFACQANALDPVGRVLDFSAIKALLCAWLEDNWDHKFLAWEKDPVMKMISDAVGARRITRPVLVSGSDGYGQKAEPAVDESIVWVPFNPTAENMAYYLLNVIGPQQLRGSGVILTEVLIEETRKCSAGVKIGGA
jgi:6-pyruvoyltetrahydropterin/6-carboxytetrahydropterin synthase